MGFRWRRRELRTPEEKLEVCRLTGGDPSGFTRFPKRFKVKKRKMGEEPLD